MNPERKLLKNLIVHSIKKEASIIVGARQTGKTTLLKQLKSHLNISKKNTYFVSLEDIMILNELNQHPENIFKFIPRPENDRVFLLIDEIQYLANPTNFLKLLYDKYADTLKIIATGSSAFYIDDKFKDSLAGRKRIFELYTLDFEEYLLFNNAEELIHELDVIKKDETYISLKRAELSRLFSEYLIYGGYPAVALQKSVSEKEEILKELLSSYLKKDILDSGVKHSDKFTRLVILLSHQTASLLNVYELANTLGLSTSAVHNYLYVLEKSFHISTLKPFYNNIRKELTRMPKIFFNDSGLRNAVINNFNSLDLRDDKGIIIENYAYIRLRQLYGGDNIKFWRTADGNEIDFVCKEKKQHFAIETKYNVREFKLLKYKKFLKSYPEINVSCRAFLTDHNKRDIMAL